LPSKAWVKISWTDQKIRRRCEVTRFGRFGMKNVLFQKAEMYLEFHRTVPCRKPPWLKPPDPHFGRVLLDISLHVHQLHLGDPPWNSCVYHKMAIAYHKYILCDILLCHLCHLCHLCDIQIHFLVTFLGQLEDVSLSRLGHLSHLRIHEGLAQRWTLGRNGWFSGFNFFDSVAPWKVPAPEMGL
jgi:hypothetical protein